MIGDALGAIAHLLGGSIYIYRVHYEVLRDLNVCLAYVIWQKPLGGGKPRRSRRVAKKLAQRLARYGGADWRKHLREARIAFHEQQRDRTLRLCSTPLGPRIRWSPKKAT
jgi:hypothetical protein